MNLNDIIDLQSTLRDNVLTPVTFNSLTELRAKHSTFMRGGELVTVVVLGASGHKVFVWSPSSTATDDGACIIKPTDLAATDAGRWLLVASPILVAQANYNPPSLADGNTASTTVACPGAVMGDFAVASMDVTLSGVIVTAYVSATDVVTVIFQNETGGVVDIAAGALRVMVIKA